MEDIGIKLGVDGEREFSQAIREMNSGLKVLSSELKMAASEYLSNAKSEEALMAKNEVLNKQIDAQKEKVEKLREAVEYSASAHGENSKETQKWQTQLNSAQTVLNKMEHELEENNKILESNGESLNENSENLKNLGKSEDEAGKKAQDFGEVFKGAFQAKATLDIIHGIADGVKELARAFGEAIIGAADYADEILAMSIKTGVSSKTLQEFSAITELIDVDLNTFTSSLTKTTKSMSSAAGGSKETEAAYASLGVAVVDSSGQLRDSEDVFWESIDALGGVANETERDALAMTLFGKSAQELNPLIAQGSAGFLELSKKAHEMGLVMDDEALTSLND